MQQVTTVHKPKMMIIKEVAETGILKESALRRLVKQNKIPGIYVGRKFLVNYDKLCEMLDNIPIESR